MVVGYGLCISSAEVETEARHAYPRSGSTHAHWGLKPGKGPLQISKEWFAKAHGQASQTLQEGFLLSRET